MQRLKNKIILSHSIFQLDNSFLRTFLFCYFLYKVIIKVKVKGWLFIYHSLQVYLITQFYKLYFIFVDIYFLRKEKYEFRKIMLFCYFLI